MWGSSSTARIFLGIVSHPFRSDNLAAEKLQRLRQQALARRRGLVLRLLGGNGGRRLHGGVAMRAIAVVRGRSRLQRSRRFKGGDTRRAGESGRRFQQRRHSRRGGGRS